MALPQPRHASHSPNRSANVLGLSEFRTTTPAHGTARTTIIVVQVFLFVTVPVPVLSTAGPRYTHTHTSHLATQTRERDHVGGKDCAPFEYPNLPRTRD